MREYDGATSGDFDVDAGSIERIETARVRP
jgi:hypothetical protein